jgi:hypothetical protein
MRRPPLERRSALKPSPGPARTAPMKRGRRGRHTAQQATARAAWKLATVGRPCAVCGVGWGWGSSAAQPLDGHHVLRREFIERTLRRKGAPVSPEVLYDLRNQLVLCRGCHDARTRAATGCRASWCRLRRGSFARELDALVPGEPFTARLESDYPDVERKEAA